MEADDEGAVELQRRRLNEFLAEIKITSDFFDPPVRPSGMADRGEAHRNRHKGDGEFRLAVAINCRNVGKNPLAAHPICHLSILIYGEDVKPAEYRVVLVKADSDEVALMGDLGGDPPQRSKTLRTGRLWQRGRLPFADLNGAVLRLDPPLPD